MALMLEGVFCLWVLFMACRSLKMPSRQICDSWKRPSKIVFAGGGRYLRQERWMFFFPMGRAATAKSCVTMAVPVLLRSTTMDVSVWFANIASPLAE